MGIEALKNPKDRIFPSKVMKYRIYADIIKFLKLYLCLACYNLSR